MSQLFMGNPPPSETFKKGKVLRMRLFLSIFATRTLVGYVDFVLIGKRGKIRAHRFQNLQKADSDLISGSREIRS